MITFTLTMLVVLALGMGLRTALGHLRIARQLRYVDQLPLGPAPRKRLRQCYPTLDDRQLELIMNGLRDYFRVCVLARQEFVSMPSQAVDEAWHALILDTRRYEQYCQKVFGRFLHHMPAETMSSPTRAQVGIRRCWKFACQLERISASRPQQLPRLFAIDQLLGIAGGFSYVLNCKDPRWGGDSYCASHIGCAGSGCAGGGGEGEGEGDGEAEGGGDGGGDGGGGCGGGCGGGGD